MFNNLVYVILTRLENADEPEYCPRCHDYWLQSLTSCMYLMHFRQEGRIRGSDLV